MLAGVGDALVGRMLCYDAWCARFKGIRLRGRDMECAVCGSSPTILSLKDTDAMNVDFATGAGDGESSC